MFQVGIQKQGTNICIFKIKISNIINKYGKCLILQGWAFISALWKTLKS